MAARVLEDCRNEIETLKAAGHTPGLAVVLVGSDPASTFYVRSKDKKCHELGLHSEKYELAAETSQDELLALIDKLNKDPKIHGILVQSPPPPHIDEAAIIRAIAPEKDVDGFHPVNVAKLVLEDPSGFVPCTPLGCQVLLESAGVPDRRGGGGGVGAQHDCRQADGVAADGEGQDRQCHRHGGAFALAGSGRHHARARTF